LNSRIITGIIIAVIGLSLLVVGIVLASQMIDTMTAGTVPQPTPVVETTVSVVTVTRDIPEGKVFEASDLTISDIPIRFVPRNSISSLDAVIGKIAKVELYEGEMVLDHNVANPTGKIFDIAYVLDETHVLMALPATDLMSRESLIQRGDIIDILVSYEEVVQQADDEDAPAVEDGEEATRRELVTFTAKQRLGITAIVIEILRERDQQADPTIVTIPQREQIVVQTYLVSLDPQDALILKYLIDIGGTLDYVIRAPTSTGDFSLTPVTSQFIRELYGLELLP
jgi:pilus assembly protein CpaB